MPEKLPSYHLGVYKADDSGDDHVYGGGYVYDFDYDSNYDCKCDCDCACG